MTEPHDPSEAHDVPADEERRPAGRDEFEIELDDEFDDGFKEESASELDRQFGPETAASETERDNLRPNIFDEVELIKRAFAHQGIAVQAPRNADGLDYLYAEHRILVLDSHLSQVEHVLTEIAHRERQERLAEGPEPGRADSPVERIIAGVVLLHLEPFGLTVAEALDAVDKALGRGIATPDHVLTVAPGAAGPCPATEPEEVIYGIEPSPMDSAAGDGAGVLAYVFDTGLLYGSTAQHPWLHGGTGQPDPRQVVFHHGRLRIRPYSGHGTFVAGVARALAPAVDMRVFNAFKVAGSTLESHLVRHLDRALGAGVDIFHLSIAATSRHDLPLIAFRRWLDRLNHYGGAICVVAAGNSGLRRYTWPGAFHDVLTVGALTADGRNRAAFSNFGGWVDVYAPGRDLVNAYAHGHYRCHIWPYRGKEREFHGMCRWNGTSFSTPVVTGMIAARMSRTGENARRAADALLAQARAQAIPGVGAVLRP